MKKTAPQSEASRPLISVIMPAYNAEMYLREAVDSILSQTYSHFELIIVNDGSTDGTADILEHYRKFDKRVRIITQKNKGLVVTLNDTIRQHAKSNYIARMDADDISLPRRFEWQIAAFKANPKVVLVGGSFEIMNEFGEFQYNDLVPSRDADIRRMLHLYNPLAHGSVMFKRDAFEKAGGYSDKVGPTEDFDLWCRLAHVGEVAGIPHAIFRWRQNPQGITNSNNGLMVRKTREYVESMWRDFPLDVINTRTLRAITMPYVEAYGDRGANIKRVILDNNCQIAIKMMARRRIAAGLRQYFAVALVGRSGLRVCYHRTKNTLRSIIFDRKNVTLPPKSPADTMLDATVSSSDAQD